MRRQISSCISSAIKQLKNHLHGSRASAVCVGHRSVHSDVDEINKEMAELFGTPSPPEGTCIGPAMSDAADAAAQSAIDYLGDSSSQGSVAAAWPNNEPAAPWNHHMQQPSSSHAAYEPGQPLARAQLLAPQQQQQQQQLVEAQEAAPPALEQLQQCTAQLQEQVQAMSRILQELAQEQQQQQRYVQHGRFNHPSDPIDPSTPPAAAHRPHSMMQQQQLESLGHLDAAVSLISRAGTFSSAASAATAAAAAPVPEQQLTHVDGSGKASMVDVSGKGHSSRMATASCLVLLGPTAFDLVKSNSMAKGDVLTLAQVAGIQGAKQTASLIPLCHNIFLSKVDVQARLQEEQHAVAITATAKTVGQTGVEMEALTAAAVAALTVYDMCKAVSKDIQVTGLQLDFKEGGKSGTWAREGSC